MAQSQTNLINGRVLDKNNFPLPGKNFSVMKSKATKFVPRFVPN